MNFEEFGKFGIVSHTKESKAVEFVACLEQGKVMAAKCKECKKVYFPPQVDCPKCLDSEVEWTEVKGAGKLLTYSVINYGPVGFEDKAPYVLGVGEFEGGVRIFCSISKDIKDTDLKIGMAVKVLPVKLGDDKLCIEFQEAG